MPSTKIMLSGEELALLADPGLILAKRRILEKAGEGLGELVKPFAEILKRADHIPSIVKDTLPKISKGENYLQFPWIVLDYPRAYGQKDIFAIRCMLWWSKGFSISLHLAGQYKSDFEEILLGNLLKHRKTFQLCINEDQWKHHYEEDNYKAVTDMGERELSAAIRDRYFIKLTRIFPISAWNDSPALLQDGFVELVDLLSD